jgi:signal transduction histidine kinase
LKTDIEPQGAKYRTTLIVAGLLTSAVTALRQAGDFLQGKSTDSRLLTGRAIFFVTGLSAAALFASLPPRQTRSVAIALIPCWIAGLVAVISGTGGPQSPYLWALLSAPLIIAILAPTDVLLVTVWGISAPSVCAALYWKGGEPELALAWGSVSGLVSAFAIFGVVRFRQVRQQLDEHLLSENRRIAEALDAGAAKLFWVRSEKDVLLVAEETLDRLKLSPQLHLGPVPFKPEADQTVLPLTHEDGQVGAVVLRGLSEFRGQKSTLELFVRHVSGALENVRHLQRARRQLEEVQRLQRELVAQERLAALGEAAAAMAHEVRNPLGSMLNGVSLLGRPLEDAQRQEILDMVREDGFRLERLVQDLLYLARPLEPSVREVNLMELANSAVETVTKRTAHDWTLTLEGESHVPARGDPNHLLLAIENLVRNAAQSTPAGGHITLRVHQAEQSALLSVEDDGPGIPQEQWEKIFEPFFSTRSTGTGLGLAIVKRVVKAHGGTVSAGKALLGGARFEISIPAA